jgi:hypothetical protein
VRPNRPWSDFDDLKATEWLQTPEIGILVSSGVVREAVQAIAHENRFHPVLEWLEGLHGTAQSAWAPGSQPTWACPARRSPTRSAVSS